MNFIVDRVFKNKDRSRWSPTYYLPPEIWQQVIEEAMQPKLAQWFESGPCPHELSLVTYELEDRFYGRNRYLVSFQKRIATILLVCRQWNELATFASKKWSLTALPRDNDIEVSPRAAVLDIGYAYDSDLQPHLKKFNPEYVSVLSLQKREPGDLFLGLEDLTRFPHLRAIHLSSMTSAGNFFSMLKTIEKGIPRLELLSFFADVRQPETNRIGVSFPLLQTLIIRMFSSDDWPTKDWELPSISKLSMTSKDDRLAKFPPLSLLYSQQLLSLTIHPWPSNDAIDFWETFPSLISVSGDIQEIPLKTSPLHPLRHLDQYNWRHGRWWQYCSRFEEHIESSFDTGGVGIRSVVLPLHQSWTWDIIPNDEIRTVLAFEKYCSKHGVRIYTGAGDIVFSVKDEIKWGLSKRKRLAIILDAMIYE